MPRVSVNICCYNSEKYIKSTICSVLAQTYTDYEIIVVDDGSKDKTGEIVKAFVDPRIKYYYQENRGLSFSRNQALSLSSGEYIALLDHDDLWDADKLALQIKIFEAEPGTGVVYSGARSIDESGRTLSDVSQARYRRGRVTKDLIVTDFITCPTIVFRRSLLNVSGPFREQFAQVEEYDLLLRLSLFTDFAYVPKVVVSYRKHATNASRDLVRVYTEWIQCLSDFMGYAGAERFNDQVQRSIFFQQALFALFYLYNSKYREADAVMRGMSPVENVQKFIYLPILRLLSVWPAGVRRVLLQPFKVRGMVSDL